MDAERITAVLRDALHEQDEQFADASIVNVVSMPGGLSRLMFRFDVVVAGTPARYVLRADPPAGHSIVTDRMREWAVLDWLAGSVAPQARWFLPASGPLGVDAIVTDFVDGRPLAVLAAESPAAALEARPAICAAAAAIHGRSLDDAPPELAVPASWDDFIDERVDQLLRLESDHCEPLPGLRYLARWLSARRPAPGPLTLVHGDFETPNIIIRPDGSACVVDWELAHVGDPRADLGLFALIGETMPPDVYGNDPVAFCDGYRELSGCEEDVVNPETLPYFMVLSAMNGPNFLLPQIATAAAGGTDSILAHFWPRALMMLQQGGWTAMSKAREGHLVKDRSS